MPIDLQSHWNHNTHDHRLLLKEIPSGARSALDVGSGDALLAADLREVVPKVTGIDLDADVVDRARNLDTRRPLDRRRRNDTRVPR